MELNASSLSDLSDNQIKFLHKHKLAGDQLQIALAVDAEARRQGVNPEFVWPMVYQESKFQQDAASPKGAIGVMQLMPDTAKGLKVDASDVAQNISGGVALLKELMSNPKIGNDPYKVLAGYNASTETRNKFYESGDLADLPDETIKHMYQVGKHYGGELPNVSFEPQAQSEPDKVIEAADAPADGNIYGGTPVTEYEGSGAQSPKEMGALSGLTGAGLGTVYSAKAPALRLAQRIGILPGGQPISPTEAAQLVEKTMTGNTPQTTSKPVHGGEKWQKSLTGISTPGAQMSKDSLDLAKDMQSAVGIKGAPGFTGGTITEGGIILNPRDAAAVQARNTPVAPPQAAQPDMAQRVSKNIMGSSPVRGGLSGLGVGYNVQDAYNKFDQGDVLSGLLSSGAAGASGAALAPKLAARMNPLAVGLTTASQVAGDLKRGDKQSAAESGLTGLATLMPRLFGPAGAAVYSSGLNKDEMQELERRRMMQPTISR